MTAGSGKPLSQKLGIKPRDTVLVIDPPAYYAALLEPMPDGAVISEKTADPAIVHAFILSLTALDAAAERFVSLPRAGGALWVSWPRKTSTPFIDLTDNGVRKIMLPTGWVDVKVCAIDADWWGLRFLRRRQTEVAS